MDSRQVQSFKDWFNDYVKNFYSKDPAIQEGIKFKEEHTKRVCGNIVLIGSSIDLQDADLNLAETIALFHDTGRFRQVAVYRTFNDRISENHSLLGLSELERAGVLSSLAEIARNGCVEKIIASLPSTAEIREVRNCLREYLDLRLAAFDKQ